MSITAIIIKLFGKRAPLYRVMKDGEVVQVFVTMEEARVWIAAQ